MSWDHCSPHGMKLIHPLNPLIPPSLETADDYSILLLLLIDSLLQSWMDYDSDSVFDYSDSVFDSGFDSFSDSDRASDSDSDPH